MDSKETIYKRHHTYAEFDLIPNKESCLNAMDEWADIKVSEFISQQNSFTQTTVVPEYILNQYAKQVAIDFGRYLDAEGINFERTGFVPEMFDEYLKSKK